MEKTIWVKNKVGRIVEVPVSLGRKMVIKDNAEIIDTPKTPSKKEEEKTEAKVKVIDKK